MAFFPAAVPTAADLLVALNNTRVLLDVAAGIGDTTITVDDASPLGSSGYLTFNDDEDNPETIAYTGKAGNDLTGVTRGADGTTAAAHVADGTVGLEVRWNARYHNILTEEIVAIADNIRDRFGLNTDVVIPAGVNFTLQKTTSQIVLGTTNTTTINATAPAASRVYTIPDAGGAASFVLTGGTQTLSGATTFSAGVTIAATTNQIVLGTTNTTTITAPAPAAGRVYTIPDAGGAASFVLNVGASTISGAKTFASSALLLQEAAGSDVVTVAVAALATGRTYTVPDAGGAADFLMSAGAQTITGTKTFSGATIAMGSNKITGLANGTVSGDAIHFGQYQDRAVNIIDNGGFEVWQRGTSFSAPANSSYTADRWQISTTENTNVTVTKETTTIDAVGLASMKVVVSSVGASKVWYVYNTVENYADYRGKSVSFSVRVNTAVASAIKIAVADNTSVIASSSYHTGGGGWETLTVTAAVGAAVTQLYVLVGMINAGDKKNGTFYWDSSMLAQGSEPVAFVPINTELEWSRCQRFYTRLGSFSVDEMLVNGMCYTTTNFQAVWTYPVEMRTTPTVTVVGTLSEFKIYNSAATGLAATAVSGGGSGNRRSCNVAGTVASGLIAGNASQMYSHAVGSYIEASADF